jgi:hypothetical protein
LRLRRSRSRGSVLAVVGGCLGVYAVSAVAFHWLVEPTVKSQQVAPYEPSLARAVQSSATSFVTPARPDLPSRVTSKPPASATLAAPASKSTEPARSEPPSRVPPPPMTVTAAGPKPTVESARAEARVVPPMMTTAKPTETAQSAAPSSAAAEAPMTTAGPAPMETSEQPSLVASDSAASSAAAQQSAEAAPAPKKKKVARKTPRHDRSRDYWNPMNFFAWGSPYGARRSF